MERPPPDEATAGGSSTSDSSTSSLLDRATSAVVAMRQHCEDYPYVWASYGVTFALMGFYSARAWQRLRRAEDDSATNMENEEGSSTAWMERESEDEVRHSALDLIKRMEEDGSWKLPSERRIQVPHVRQQHSWDCGVACVLMVLKALRIPIHPVHTEPMQSILAVHSPQPIGASPAMPAATSATRFSRSSVVPAAHAATAVIHAPATAASPALIDRAIDTVADPAAAAATAFSTPPPSSAVMGATTSRFPAVNAHPATSPLAGDSFALEAPHEELSLHGSAQARQGGKTGAQGEAVHKSAAVEELTCPSDTGLARVVAEGALASWDSIGQAEGADATWHSLEAAGGAAGCGDVGEGANGCMRRAEGAGVGTEGLVRRGSARGRGCAVRGGEEGCDVVHATTREVRAVACASAGIGRGRAAGSRETCELQQLHRQCGTTSVWSIDLVALLQRHGVGVEFLTVTISANPSFAQQPFYKENMPGDVDRVNRLFADTIRAGVHIQCASIGIQHVAWLLLSGRYLIIALVDKRTIT
ncbi:unnamed protein product [Closterium sp. Yama58-4]|nr:unnamed protein product [Closterium sp. Yama58-4]